jgi:hypothetical protein
VDAGEYWPYYCEENIWHACAAPVSKGEDASAVFVSNPTRSVAMWQQQAAPPGRPIVWDYHVVLLLGTQGRSEIVDPDCRRGPRLPAKDWIDASFPPLPARQSSLAPLFRLVPAAVYRRELCSDRSHMRTADDWSQPPPPWPAIGEGMNLMRFVDMETDFLGEVLDLESFRKRLNPRAGSHA